MNNKSVMSKLSTIEELYPEFTRKFFAKQFPDTDETMINASINGFIDIINITKTNHTLVDNINGIDVILSNEFHKRFLTLQYNDDHLCNIPMISVLGPGFDIDKQDYIFIVNDKFLEADADTQSYMLCHEFGHILSNDTHNEYTADAFAIKQLGQVAVNVIEKLTSMLREYIHLSEAYKFYYEFMLTRVDFAKSLIK